MKNSIPVFGNNMILQKPTNNEQLTSISDVVVTRVDGSRVSSLVLSSGFGHV